MSIGQPDGESIYMNVHKVRQMWSSFILMKQIAAQHLVIHPGFIKNTMIDTDGRHLCKFNPTIILEVKNEIFSTGRDPSF